MTKFRFWNQALADRLRLQTARRIRGDDNAKRMRDIGCRHADQCTHPRCQCPVVRVDELHTLRARTEVES